MKKNFSSLIPSNWGKLFINGIYPLHKYDLKSQIIKKRYAWYFFNPYENKYIISPEIPADIVCELIKKLGLDTKETIVFGYSQGGYLAPFIGHRLKSRSVLSIGANYRYDLMPNKAPFQLIAINGEKDQVVDIENSFKSFNVFINSKNHGQYIRLPHSGHLIEKYFIEQIKNIVDIL